MNFLRRNKRKIYLCEAISENGVTTFSAPEELLVNFEPLNSAESLETFGLEYRDYLIIKCSKKIAPKFKSGNKCYVFVEPPKTSDRLCKKCDYMVYSEPSNCLNNIEVILKKLL